jgi:hypothetical protein
MILKNSQKIELFFVKSYNNDNFKNPFFSPLIFSAADFFNALKPKLKAILLLNNIHICETPQQVSDRVMGNFFKENCY